MARRALCIGINDYPGTDSDLFGCVNDSDDWAAALGERGFSIQTLKNSEATRDAMLAAMREIVASAVDDDVVVVTYSGHGTWVPDQDADENDLRDEAMCPYDLVTNGPIIDDDLYGVFGETARGARAVLVSDSCHSGTLQKFAPALGGRKARVRFLPPATFIQGERQLTCARRTSATPGGAARLRRTALLLAGCRDTEYCFDAEFSGRANGAFSYVALSALRELPEGATYRDWMAQIKKGLPSADYPQTPQLEGSSHQRGWPVFA